MSKKLKELCLRLNLKTVLNHLPQTLETAAQKNWTPLQIMEHLFDLEYQAKQQRRKAMLLKKSQLPFTPTVDQFNFQFHPSRKRQKSLTLQLMDLEFIDQKKDIIFIGPPGTGKTFLVNCIGYASTQAGIKTLFTTAMDMINHLIAAEADHSLLKMLKIYQEPDLLICDEIGYLPLGTQGSNLFFQVISARHERKSTILTTNLPFAKWGTIFDSTIVATAIADRLVYNSEVIIFEGKSYRTRDNHKKI